MGCWIELWESIQGFVLKETTTFYTRGKFIYDGKLMDAEQ